METWFLLKSTFVCSSAQDAYLSKLLPQRDCSEADVAFAFYEVNFTKQRTEEENLLRSSPPTSS